MGPGSRFFRADRKTVFWTSGREERGICSPRCEGGKRRGTPVAPANLCRLDGQRKKKGELVTSGRHGRGGGARRTCTIASTWSGGKKQGAIGWKTHGSEVFSLLWSRAKKKGGRPISEKGEEKRGKFPVHVQEKST